jgi:hypothetical protein
MMTLRRKLLVAALALGTVAGYGAGFAHIRMMHGGWCHRAAWSDGADGPDGRPCGRGHGRFGHQSRRLETPWGSAELRVTPNP